MSEAALRPARLERQLAAMLSYGTWLASAVIAIGLALTLIGWPGGAGDIVTTGIALFILLPVSRVILMLIVFLHERDYRFGAVAALVLAIMVLGFALGTLPAFRV
jgi:uncharacterized membrane protein